MRAKKLAVKTLKKLFPETAAYEEGVTRGNENAQNIQPESCLSFLCEPQSTATNPVLEASTLMENSSTPEKVAEGVFVEEAEKRRVYPDDALIQELQRQVEEIKLIVQQNIAIATANREHAEVLKKKSEGLKFHSSLFKKKGEQLKNHFWRQNATLIIIIALIVVAVAIVLAMILGAMTAMIVVSLL
ncbi:hypothetical protein Pelo_6798 [Pelomyxa schiedti]|nr:hypothetical protein Pelo_6768 [Pelomyxa schiedti]KAH3761399.1 hypothetical protein Pelo_6798 [Pelomyxa schiedti]